MRTCRSLPAAVAATAFRIVHGPDTAPSMLPLSATSVLAPIPELAQAASTLGHTNGTARYEFPAVAYGDDIYPSFALEVARQHLGVARENVRLELGRGVWLGDRLVPTDDRTQLVVNYRGPDRFRTVSFAQLLAGDVPRRRLRGQGGADRRQRRRRRRDLRHAVRCVPARRSNGAPR